MSIIETQDAATRLAELVKRAATGEEILLSEDGKTVARIVSVTARDADGFKDWLLNGPKCDDLDELIPPRDATPPREIDL